MGCDFFPSFFSWVDHGFASSKMGVMRGSFFFFFVVRSSSLWEKKVLGCAFTKGYHRKS
jgi:hypothetical protein